MHNLFSYKSFYLSNNFYFLGVVVSLPVHVSESGDEGLGSMSPEPLSVITMSADGHAATTAEVADLKRQLERERHGRLVLEKQMRHMQTQLLPERFREGQLIAYQPHEVRILQLFIKKLSTKQKKKKTFTFRSSSTRTTCP